MGIRVDLGIAKIDKYASRESGDTVEFVERPGGALSIVVVDGQGSGAAAKALSVALTGRAVALMKEGVRDGVVARAVHDMLFTLRRGQVSASLAIVTVDTREGTLIITRNGDGAVALEERGGPWRLLEGSAPPLGRYRFTRPQITLLGARPELRLIACTDGVIGSGRKRGMTAAELPDLAAGDWSIGEPAEAGADALIQTALLRDDGRAGDDMTVVAMRLLDHAEPVLIRRLRADVPLP